MNISVVPVVGNKQLKWFIDFPHDLYKADPNYVPALYVSEKFLLTKHPFHRHSSMSLFLAISEGKIVGRIAAILNNNHNSFNTEQDGFFGFFDCIDNTEVSAALIRTAEGWLKNKNVKTIIGPVNPSTNETCGMLIEGYGEPPVVMMTYNAAYYPNLLEQIGFKKKTDLLAYSIEAGDFDDKPVRLLQAFKDRLNQKGITIRKGNMKQFDKEVRGFMKVYNQAWDKNLGFVPMTDDEFLQMGKEAKMVLDEDFCLVAEHNGTIVGFALCLPDINQIQIKLKKGRLFPVGFAKMLLGKNKLTRMRVLALGVLEPYRKMGIEAVFYGSIIQNGLNKGITQAEASWILEGNTMMNRALEHINGKVYKRYRIFEKQIS